MVQQSSKPVILTGFLTVEKTITGDGYIAALMVTDYRGYPLEFRATTPVRPSLVQRTLYGKQLEHYVGVELCGKALLENSQRKPKVVLVPEKFLLDIADQTPVNIIAVWRSGESLKVENGKTTTLGTIKQPPGSPFGSVVYDGRFIDDDSQRSILVHLQESTSRFDLMEAFERMRSALQLLAKEDLRYA